MQFLNSLQTNGGTTTTSLLTALFGVLAFQPEMVEFLPDSIEGYVVGTSKILFYVMFAVFGWSVKGKNVTGGTIPATKEAKDRIVKEISEFETEYPLGDPVPPEIDGVEVRKAEVVNYEK